MKKKRLQRSNSAKPHLATNLLPCYIPVTTLILLFPYYQQFKCSK